MFHALHRVFKDKIRQLTCRSKSQSMKDRINNLNTYMVGWMGYLYLLN
ncbi:MAG TPA: group II intron maturase-specific domain-containing protein [Bacillota bacterium]|nr:group II intron maturase-specific domain-containing protein [Bacillota bacterium]